jgi:hypothetical protein
MNTDVSQVEVLAEVMSLGGDWFRFASARNQPAAIPEGN